MLRLLAARRVASIAFRAFQKPMAFKHRFAWSAVNDGAA